MAHKFKFGEIVIIPWGITEVRGTVREIYGPADLSEVTIARLSRCFDDPVPNPGGPASG